MRQLRRIVIMSAATLAVFANHGSAFAGWTPIPKPPGVTSFYSIAAGPGLVFAAANGGSGGALYAAAAPNWVWGNLLSGFAHIPLEIAADSSNRLYLIDSADHHPYRWVGGSTFALVGATVGNMPGQGDPFCPAPTEIAVAADRFYVGPCTDGAIFSSNGTTETWGEAGLPQGFSGRTVAIGGNFLSGALVMDTAGNTWSTTTLGYVAATRPDVAFQRHSHALAHLGGAWLAVGAGTGDGQLLIYNGSAWAPFSAGGSVRKIAASSAIIAAVTNAGDTWVWQP